MPNPLKPPDSPNPPNPPEPPEPPGPPNTPRELSAPPRAGARPATAPRPRVAAAAVLLAALAAASLTACGSDAKASDADSDAAGTDTSVSMPAWYAGGGNTHMATVSRDVTSVDDDAAANDTSSMGSDCTTLLTDVQAAQVYAPAPDIVTQQHWSDALDSLAQSAADCSDGATRSDSGLIAKADRERRTGSAELRVAMESAADLGDG